jgi:hypothetical protein
MSANKKLTKEERGKKYSEVLGRLNKAELELAKCIKEIFDDELYKEAGCKSKKDCAETILVMENFKSAVRYYNLANDYFPENNNNEKKYIDAIGKAEKHEKKMQEALKEIITEELYKSVGYENAKEFIGFVFGPSSLLGIAAAMELKKSGK